MRNCFPYILCLFIAACGTENPQPEKKNSEKVVVPDSASTALVQDSATEAVIELHALKKIPFQQKCDSFIAAYRVNYDEQKFEKRPVLMRFENVWMKQLSFIKKFTVKHGDLDVYPVANLSFYEYSDSTQRANAYSNWLACFGSDCNQIVSNEEVQIKSTPGFYIVNEKEIITLDYPLEHEKNNWAAMKKNLRILFANPTSILIEVAPHGRVKWLK